ncbi:MAG: tRNA pseudouridine synthase A [candidate division TM6 bacterium GW2011_GWF2_32_72]|nr:MAG: tRNA pseudouridine synthase A [candidate division TM6 bacterium GW2011_GWF2_32_72]
MKTYKIIVAYDGTDYQGWQEQPHGKTVVQALQKSFKAAFFLPILIKGASRTDAGVHALGQVAKFQTTLNISAKQLLKVWEQKVPSDISIISIEEVDPEFKPTHNVIEKTYSYKIFTKRPLPQEQRFGVEWKKKLDINKLKTCLKIFVGTHDFRSFCSGYEFTGGSVRTINSISIESENMNNTITIVFKGPGFLKYMIRRIVGACLQAASCKKLNETDLQKAMDEKNPLQSLLTAPAKGLTLEKIEYK